MESNKQIYYDLLIIEDIESWRELTIQVCNDLGFKYDTANGYDNAKEKIHARNYKAVFMNWNFGTKHNGNRLLKIISNYSETPVALISGYFIGGLSNLKKKYPNVRETVVKYQKEDDEQEYIEELFDIIPSLVKLGDNIKQHKDNNRLARGNKIMILDQLTTTTISTGISFLFGQLTKIADRLNNEQLKKIEEKKKEIQDMPVETDRDIATVQNSIIELKKILPDDTEIDSIDAFASWVEEQLDANFDELIGVGELMVKVLRENKKSEKNAQKKIKISKMETSLNNDVHKFIEKLELGEEGNAERQDLYQRIGFALDIIKNS